MNTEKGFCFLQFASPLHATIALEFDGVLFRNNALRFRRPNDYVPPKEVEQPAPQLSGPAFTEGIVSTSVADTPHKVFMGNLPSHVG